LCVVCMNLDEAVALYYLQEILLATCLVSSVGVRMLVCVWIVRYLLVHNI